MGSARASTKRAPFNNIKEKEITIKRKMAKQENLTERMDTIKANSVSDREFEETWGISLEDHVKNMMAKWDTLLAQAKDAIDSDKQPADERQQLAADANNDSAEKQAAKKTLYVIKNQTNKKFDKKQVAKLIQLVFEYLKQAFANCELIIKEKEEENECNEDSALIGILFFHCDVARQEKDEDELLTQLNRAMPEGVLIERCDKKNIETNVPILEMICHRRE